MATRSEETGGAPEERSPDRPFAPAGRAEGDGAPGGDKAEPEKARAEIEAGDVADELADFA